MKQITKFDEIIFFKKRLLCKTNGCGLMDTRFSLDSRINNRGIMQTNKYLVYYTMIGSPRWEKFLKFISKTRNMMGSVKHIQRLINKQRNLTTPTAKK